jgi:hypothetical protein
VTAQNRDSVMPELVSLQQLADQLGGRRAGGPEQLTVAGLPGAHATGSRRRGGTAIQDTRSSRSTTRPSTHRLPTGEERKRSNRAANRCAHIQGELAADARGPLRTAETCRRVSLTAPRYIASKAGIGSCFQLGRSPAIHWAVQVRRKWKWRTFYPLPTSRRAQLAASRDCGPP